MKYRILSSIFVVVVLLVIASLSSCQSGGVGSEELTAEVQ